MAVVLGGDLLVSAEATMQMGEVDRSFGEGVLARAKLRAPLESILISCFFFRPLDGALAKDLTLTPPCPPDGREVGNCGQLAGVMLRLGLVSVVGNWGTS